MLVIAIGGRALGSMTVCMSSHGGQDQIHTLTKADQLLACAAAAEESVAIAVFSLYSIYQQVLDGLEIRLGAVPKSKSRDAMQGERGLFLFLEGESSRRAGCQAADDATITD